MMADAVAAPALPRLEPTGSPRRHLAVRRFLRHRPALLGAIVLILILLMAIFADPLGRVSPVAIDLRAARTGPSATHVLGADQTGRDVWSRLVHASRVSLEVGIGAVAVYVSIGVLLGAVSGWYGHFVSALILRFADMVPSFPILMLVLVVVALVGP